MSTAYPPRLIKYAFSSKKERNAAIAAADLLINREYGRWPIAFALYYAGPGEDFLSQRFYIRDNNEDKAKLYAVSYFKGPGTAQMVLYASPEHAPPALAISSSEKRFSSSVVVKAPPAPLPSEHGTSTVNLKYSARPKMHTFALSDNGRIALYEWREDSAIKPKIRRLVRLPNAMRGAEEVIAVWKEGSVPSREGRLAGFEFTSAEAWAELGNYGTLIAVSSVLAISAILGAGIDGTASWEQEKALEKGHQSGDWQDQIGTGNSGPPAEWQDPWLQSKPP